jgi:hypothetical protein
MERFKWFDYLGALLLLFSVTKSAITPQVSDEPLSPSAIPPKSVDQMTDSFQHISEQGLELQVERLGPSGGPLLEEGSDLSSFEGEVDSEILWGYSKKNILQALSPTLSLAVGEKLGALNTYWNPSFLIRTLPRLFQPLFGR